MAAARSFTDLLAEPLLCLSRDCGNGELEVLEEWLIGQICACSRSSVLPLLMSFLPLIILACDHSPTLQCGSIILSLEEVHVLKALQAPSLQRIFIIVQGGNSPPELPLLIGRKAVVLVCGSQTAYVKTEFEQSFHQIQANQLSLNLPGNAIDAQREVVIATFNCTVFAQLGTLSAKGKPSWYNGLELTGIIKSLEWRGLRWRVEPAKGYGEVYPNGSLEEGGIKWMLAEGQADIGVCSLWIMANLSQELSPTESPRFSICTRLLVPRPKIEWHWLASLMGLPLPFWILHLSCTILTTVIIYLNYLRTNARHRNYQYSCYQAFRMCLQGNVPSLSSRFDWRLLQLSWAVLVLISSNAFSCFLVAKMTTPLPREPIENIKDMINQGYTWASGFKPLHSPAHLFHLSKDIMEKWLNIQVPSDQVTEGQTALYTQELGDIVFIGQPELFKRNFLDGLIASKKCLGVNQLSTMTRRLSSYNKLLSEIQVHLNEYGLFEKIKSDALSEPTVRRYILQGAHHTIRSSRGSPRLRLRQLSGGFYFLLAGLLLCSVVFTIELVINY